MWVYLVALAALVCLTVVVLATVAIKSHITNIVNVTNITRVLDRLVAVIAALLAVAFPAYLAEEYPETRESVIKGCEYIIYTAVLLAILWFVLRIGLPLIFSRGKTTKKTYDDKGEER